jgi:hypothetical protein
VPVSMMQIGIMRVLVPHRLVLMPMRVRFSYWRVVVVLVMIVVDMPVFVRKRFRPSKNSRAYSAVYLAVNEWPYRLAENTTIAFGVSSASSFPVIIFGLAGVSGTVTVLPPS